MSELQLVDLYVKIKGASKEYFFAEKKIHHLSMAYIVQFLGGISGLIGINLSKKIF